MPSGVRLAIALAAVTWVASSTLATSVEVDSSDEPGSGLTTEVEPVDQTTRSAPSPALEEFESRRASLPANDLTALTRLAGWAEQHGLAAQAQACYRQVLDQQPLHDEAYLGLRRLAQDRNPPVESDSLRLARRLLGPKFRDYQTSRFIVLADTDAQWAIAQGNRLERTYHQVHRFTSRLGLRPWPLRHKLVCILFASRDDYRAFARSHDDVTDPWISGYYAPTRDWIVFYHVESNPSVGDARQKLEQMQQTIRELRDQRRQAELGGRSDQATMLAQSLHQHEQHLRLQTEKVDEFSRQVSAATTVHEATHQLLFHTRVQSPRSAYPLWISEGLATAFETQSPEHAFGPDHDYQPRRQAFEALLRADDLMPLRDLIGLMPTDSLSGDMMHRVYSQSYALTTWLCRHRSAAMRTFLLGQGCPVGAASEPAAAGHDPPVTAPADPISQRMVEWFETAFGPVDQLESQWLKDERRRASR